MSTVTECAAGEAETECGGDHQLLSLFTGLESHQPPGTGPGKFHVHQPHIEDAFDADSGWLLRYWHVDEFWDWTTLFRGSTSLYSLDLSKWNVYKVTGMHGMFHMVQKAVSLDLTGWDPQAPNRAGDIGHLFVNMQMAEYIHGLDDWVTKEVTSMQGTFSGCMNLNWGNGVGLTSVSNWNVTKVQTFAQTFAKTVRISPSQVQEANWLKNWQTHDATTMNEMFRQAYDACPKAMNWNTKKVQNFAHMFSASKCASLPVEKWKVPQATTMFAMFSHSRANPNFDKWNTQNLGNMGEFAKNAYALTGETMSKFKTQGVTTMKDAFSNSKLASPDVRFWNVVTNGHLMAFFLGAKLNENCTKIAPNLNENSTAKSGHTATILED